MRGKYYMNTLMMVLLRPGESAGGYVNVSVSCAHLHAQRGQGRKSHGDKKQHCVTYDTWGCPKDHVIFP